MVNLGDEFPNFDADTTVGEIKFHDWMDDSWAILFSHPADYTPVCTTELGRVVQLSEEFKKRGVKMIALSCDSVEDHNGWTKDIIDYSGCSSVKDFSYPIIADSKRELAVKLGMLDPDEKNKEGLPLTCRAVFIIGPDKKLKLSMLYPATTGRNFTEILRVIDSLKLTAEKKVATPADWNQGEKCMVVPSVRPEDVDKLFPKGVEFEVVTVEMYIPNPLRCFNYHKFEHHEDNCRQQKRCAYCGQAGHQDDDVGDCESSSPCCPNCKRVPKEKEILLVKYTRGGSFPEARKIFDISTPVQNSYAQRVKSKIQSCDASTQTCDASTQTEPNQKNTNINKQQPSSQQKSIPSTSNKKTDKPVPSSSSPSSSSTSNKQGANQRSQSSNPGRRINVSSDRAKKDLHYKTI